jgi:hypothetical protein
MNTTTIKHLSPYIARLGAEGNWGYPRWAEMLQATGLDIETARQIALAKPANIPPGRALRFIKRALRQPAAYAAAAL